MSEIDRLRGHSLQCLGPVAVAADRKSLGLERHRHRSQDVPVVIDESNRAGHGSSPKGHRGAAAQRRRRFSPA